MKHILVPVDLLSELAESLACELDARYPASVRFYESQDRKYQAEMEPVLTARQIIAAAPAVQGEPVAYLRKDQLRQVQRMGPMLGEIADSPRVDRVPVYAASQPAEQHPDVTQLVEALARCRHEASYSIGEEDALSIQLGKVRDIVNETLSTLAPYRKGGEE